MFTKIKNLFFPYQSPCLTQLIYAHYPVDISNKNIKISADKIKIFLPVVLNIKYDDTVKKQIISDIQKQYPHHDVHIIMDCVTDSVSDSTIPTPAVNSSPAPTITKPVFGKHGTNKKINRTHIKYILAVASGKGGVGKSTISLNLARAFVKRGLKTGLIDADIHGPSIPVMTGGYKMAEYADKKLLPIIHDGLKTMSIGFMVNPDKPIVWRGPLVSGAMTQMFDDVAWGDLDMMVIDMPPGTGDAQLTLCQNIMPDAAVIISTPQITSVMDARRCSQMFENLNIKISGVIENMCGFIAPDTGKEYFIFGKGGAKDFAETSHYPFLGQLPIYMEIPFLTDMGQGFYQHDNTKKIAEQFDTFADDILKNIESV